MPEFKEIEPNTDALDRYFVKNRHKTLGSARETVMRCVNRMVNPHKPYDKTYIYDSWGYVLAIKCYASKRWCPLEGPKAVVFGKRGGTKGATKTGYDRRSKKARKVWDAAIDEYREKDEALKTQVLNGTLTREQYHTQNLKLLDARANTFKDWDEGFATVEECIDYLKEQGLYN